MPDAILRVLASREPRAAYDTNTQVRARITPHFPTQLGGSRALPVIRSEVGLPYAA